MKTVILDTDFLVHCASHRVDYEEELRRIINCSYQIYIIDKTIDELNHIVENQKGKAKAAAKLAKAILENNQLPLIKTKKDQIVDELILDAVNKDTIVATMDADLKRKLKAKGVSVVILRQKKYLVLISH